MMKTLLLLEMYFFVHIKITKYVEPKDNIVEIPPAIYERLLYSSNRLTICRLRDNYNEVGSTDVGIVKSVSDEKYYMFGGKQLESIGAYLTGYYSLKDI